MLMLRNYSTYCNSITLSTIDQSASPIVCHLITPQILRQLIPLIKQIPTQTPLQANMQHPLTKKKYQMMKNNKVILHKINLIKKKISSSTAILNQLRFVRGLGSGSKLFLSNTCKIRTLQYSMCPESICNFSQRILAFSPLSGMTLL